MTQPNDLVRMHRTPAITDATLVLAFSGWMDGGDVSTGTVQRLVDLVNAAPLADIDPESFYIYNFPGSMEISALFRPHISIEDGLIKSINMPADTFYIHESANLVLFIGKEPNLRWQTFGECIFHVARQVDVRRILFVGSFGGSVPHTRQPRLYITCSDAKLRLGSSPSNRIGRGLWCLWAAQLAQQLRNPLSSIGLFLCKMLCKMPTPPLPSAPVLPQPVLF